LSEHSHCDLLAINDEKRVLALFSTHYWDRFRALPDPAGGELPEDWRLLSRSLDLVSLCEMLSRDSIPHDMAAELTELIESTLHEPVVERGRRVHD
jgi:hypothetical protein